MKRARERVSSIRRRAAQTRRVRWVLRKVLMVLGSLVGGESGMVVGG